MSEADERKSGTVTPKLDRENQAFVVADELGIILDVNDRFEQLFGWKHEQIVGMPLTTIIPPRLRQAHHLGFSRFVTTACRTFWADPCGWPLFGATAKSLTPSTSSWPTRTARRGRSRRPCARWEARPTVPTMVDLRPVVVELQSTLGTLETALNLVPDGIVWTDEAGLVRWSNGAFDRLVGVAERSPIPTTPRSNRVR